MKKPSQKRNGK